MATTERTESRQARIARLKKQIRPGFSELAERVTADNRETLDVLEEYDRKSHTADAGANSTANGKR